MLLNNVFIMYFCELKKKKKKNKNLCLNKELL